MTSLAIFLMALTTTSPQTSFQLNSQKQKRHSLVLAAQ
jgi:hypothetical protein